MGWCDIVLLFVMLATVAPAAPPTLDLQLVANQVSNVTCIANAGAGSGRLFIVEQAGRIKVFDGTKVLATPFLNIQPMVLNNATERGLLGLAFHPGYATNGAFYVYFTALDS